MTTYLFRLFCLSLASFFLLHSLLALSILALAPRVVRASKKLRSDVAARLLFRLRLAPFAVSLLLVAGLAIPSFLLLEPESEKEAVGSLCLVAAALGGALLLFPALRSLRAGIASIRLGRFWEMTGIRIRIAGAPAPVFMVNEDRPVLALHGIVHPRILISSGIVNALSPELMSAAMRHEAAHVSARDNLRKLALILAPGVFPFIHGFRSLEQAWAQAAEWAADDRASTGGAGSPIVLAEALVRIARMADAPRLPLLTTSLLSRRAEFSLRVERLLEPSPFHAPRRIPVLIVLLPFLAVTAFLFRNDTLHAVHRLLEYLVQ
jgi:Zn-dependent protease with chaperone function